MYRDLVQCRGAVVQETNLIKRPGTESDYLTEVWRKSKFWYKSLVQKMSLGEWPGTATEF